MKISFYDIYLLITKNQGISFGITKLLTDNIFSIRIKIFINKKKAKIIEAKFKVKSGTILKTGISRDFNNCYITIKAKSIMVMQKNQVEKLTLVDIKNNLKKQ